MSPRSHADVASSDILITPRRHFSYFTPRFPSALWAIAFSCSFAASTLLSVTALGQPAVLAFFGCAGLMLLLFPYMVYQANVWNAVLWCYPAWLLFSANWSNIPDRTVHNVLLLLPTIMAGTALGGINDRRAVNLGAAIALSFYMIYSLANSSTILFSDTGSGGVALTGLSAGKNFYGHISAMALLMAPSFFAYARHRFGALAIVTGCFGVAASLYGLVGSHATGSLLAAMIGFATYPAILLFRRISWQLRIVLMAATLGAIILYIIFGEQLQEILFETVLKRFNKDTSLTGRATLWEYADRLIADHRMLGYGYGSFWHYTNPDAWTLWRMMGVQPMSGFNFHNTVREIMIDSGLVGLIIYLVSYGIAFVRFGIRSLFSGDFTDAIRFAFVVYFVVRMPVETTGLGATSVDGILLIAFLSVPVVQRLPQRDRQTPAHQPPMRSAADRPVRYAAPDLRSARS